MRRNGIRLVALGGLAAAVALAIALPAGAHKIRFETNLQFKIDVLSDTQVTYSGRIESPRATCEVGRIVNVTQAGAVIATTTTDFAGNWTVVDSKPPKGSDVTVFTPKKVLKKSRKHRHKCAPDTATRKVPGP
jgi:hypothetical protein